MQRKIRLTPVRLLALVYIGIIFLGAVLLVLPFSTKDGLSTSFSDALFTATSATCVTGLIVYDTFEHWTMFGPDRHSVVDSDGRHRLYDAGVRYLEDRRQEDRHSGAHVHAGIGQRPHRRRARRAFVDDPHRHPHLRGRGRLSALVPLYPRLRLGHGDLYLRIHFRLRFLQRGLRSDGDQRTFLLPHAIFGGSHRHFDRFRAHYRRRHRLFRLARSMPEQTSFQKIFSAHEIGFDHYCNSHRSAFPYYLMFGKQRALGRRASAYLAVSRRKPAHGGVQYAAAHVAARQHHRHHNPFDVHRRLLGLHRGRNQDDDVRDADLVHVFARQA